jgi:uncharacterized protein YjbI with pentapeptide repeats
VDYILSGQGMGLGAVGVQDERIYAAREFKKADDRPGNYKATGGHGGILGGDYLSKANLTGANLTGANLTDADLRGADLTGVDLTGANLTGANLTGANLTGANLKGANLKWANLKWANLDNVIGADFTGAKNVPD